MRSVNALFIALILTAGALAGCLGGDGGAPAEPAAASNDQPADPAATGGGNATADSNATEGADGGVAAGGGAAPANETRRETLTESRKVAFTAGFIAGCTSANFWEVRSAPPENFTGALIELTWSSATEGSAVDGLTLWARADGEEVEPVTEPDDRGVLSLQVGPGQWSDGGLVVYFCSGYASDVPRASAEVDATWHATLWSGGPPDWSFTAVEGA